MSRAGWLAVAAHHLGPIHAGTGGAGAFIGIGFAVLLLRMILSNRG